MWTLELKGLIVTTVADPGEGPGRPGRPGRPGSPLIFRPNEAMESQKKFLGDPPPPPPLSEGLDLPL